jgi:uncharacterized membrane protein
VKNESTSRQDVRRTAAAVETSQLPQVRLSGTDRLETFSDGVLSITITLLVAEIVRPEHAPGQLFDRLVEQWPSYIAFLASFFYTGVIWLNHRAVFARVRYCDRGLHLANLFLLLTSGLIPFPTAILSSSMQIGNEFDAKIAVVLYAAIAGSMCLAWLILFHVLSIHPWLVEHHIGSDFFPKERLRAILGVVCYTVAAWRGCRCRSSLWLSSWRCPSSTGSPAKASRRPGYACNLARPSARLRSSATQTAPDSYYGFFDCLFLHRLRRR